MKRILTAAVLILSLPAITAAQTTSSPGIDLEIYDSNTGSNVICASVGEYKTAWVWVRLGSGASTCSLSCGTANGGSSRIATGLIDLSFDQTHLQVTTFGRFDVPVARDGVLKYRPTEGKLGFAMAADFTPDRDPNGSVASPCAMGLLTSSSGLYQVGFDVLRAGTSRLHLRMPDDRAPFALAFGDACGAAYTLANGGIDEVVDAVVSTQCSSPSDLIFYDGVETGSAGQWSKSVGD